MVKGWCGEKERRGIRGLPVDRWMESAWYGEAVGNGLHGRCWSAGREI